MITSTFQRVNYVESVIFTYTIMVECFPNVATIVLNLMGNN